MRRVGGLGHAFKDGKSDGSERAPEGGEVGCPDARSRRRRARRLETRPQGLRAGRLGACLQRLRAGRPERAVEGNGLGSSECGRPDVSSALLKASIRLIAPPSIRPVVLVSNCSVALVATSPMLSPGDFFIKESFHLEEPSSGGSSFPSGCLRLAAPSLDESSIRRRVLPCICVACSECFQSVSPTIAG